MKSTRLRAAASLLVLVVLLPGAGAVAGAGEPPLADAGLDQQVERNATVLLDAAGSRDPDGIIQSYRWTIETPEGRTIQPADSDSPRTSFVARQTGRYEVTVTVTDDDGQTASDTLYVDVGPATTAPSQPSAPSDPAAPSDPTPGLPESTAPASDGRLDPATPDAPLDPGSASTADSQPADPAGEGGNESCPTNTTEVGSFGCLRGEDPPATVEVSGELYVRQGSVHTYTATVSDRPGGIDDLRWSGAVGTGYSATHLFSEPPGSTVRITATVDDGEGHTTSDAIVVHVVADNSPPEVRIEGPVEACVGDPVELEGHAISSETDDEITDATWHGDPTFVPQGPGRYEVGFSATDRQGQTAKTTHTVHVREDGRCSTGEEYIPTKSRKQDKLLIRATDDNVVEGSDVSSLMQARGKIPKSGALEKLADIGAGSGRLGESAAEFVTGNRETIVVTMSAENASKLERKIRTTPNDDTTAGASGPRINEHERLKNARVKDRVETESGRVKVVIRIGKDNEGNPDKYDQQPSTREEEALTGRRTPEQESDEGSEPESSQKSVVSDPSDQTNVVEGSGAVETATGVADTVTDTVGSAFDSLVGGEADPGNGGENSSDGNKSDSSGSNEPSDSGGSTDGSGPPSTDSDRSADATDSDSTTESVTDAFSGLVGGASDDSSSSDDDAGAEASESDSGGGVSLGSGDSWGGLI